MGLSTFPLLQNNTRMVRYGDRLYKIKIKYEDESFQGKTRNFTETEAHNEIEQCFRAVLYLDERNLPLRTIVSKNFVIKPVKSPWSFPVKYTNYAFEQNGFRLKVNVFMFELLVSYKDSSIGNLLIDKSAESERNEGNVKLKVDPTKSSDIPVNEKNVNAVEDESKKNSMDMVEASGSGIDSVHVVRFCRTKDGRLYRVVASEKVANNDETTEVDNIRRRRQDKDIIVDKDAEIQKREKGKRKQEVDETNATDDEDIENVGKQEKRSKEKEKRRNITENYVVRRKSPRFSKSAGKKYKLRERIRQRRFQHTRKLDKKKVKNDEHADTRRELRSRTIQTDSESQSRSANTSPVKARERTGRKEVRGHSPAFSVKEMYESMLAERAKKGNITSSEGSSDDDKSDDFEGERGIRMKSKRTVDNSKPSTSGYRNNSERRQHVSQNLRKRPEHTRNRIGKRTSLRVTKQVTRYGIDTESEEEIDKRNIRDKHLSGSKQENQYSPRKDGEKRLKTQENYGQTRDREERHHSARLDSPKRKETQATVPEKKLVQLQPRRSKRSSHVKDAGTTENRNKDRKDTTADDNEEEEDVDSGTEESADSQTSQSQKVRLYRGNLSPQVVLAGSSLVPGVSPRVSTVKPVRRDASNQQPTTSRTLRHSRQPQSQDEESARISQLREERATEVYRNFLQHRRDRHTVEMEERAETDKLQQLYQPTGPHVATWQPSTSPRQQAPFRRSLRHQGTGLRSPNGRGVQLQSSEADTGQLSSSKQTRPNGSQIKGQGHSSQGHQSSQGQNRAGSSGQVNEQRVTRKRSSGLWGAFMDNLVTPTKKFVFGNK